MLYTDPVFQITDDLLLLPITEPIIPLTNTAICTTPNTFPNISFLSCFRSITGINFTFHPTLFDTHFLWIDSILPIILILVISFHLQCVCLFFHRDITKPFPLH